MVMPGDNVTVAVELIVPIAMEEKLRFAIREGGRTVGAGIVRVDRRVIILRSELKKASPETAGPFCVPACATFRRTFDAVPKKPGKRPV